MVQQLKFSYCTEYEFDKPVTDHHFVIKCFPYSRDRQKVIIDEMCISDNDFCVEAWDFCNNKKLYGDIILPHTEFKYMIKGRAEIDTEAADYDDRHNGIFLVETPLTMAGDRILAHVDTIREKYPDTSGYDFCSRVNSYVNSLLEYRQMCTDVNTSAEDACELGYGVCQDYTHIMISILRKFGIPARYVVGMMKGEGLSHAWVECFTDRWYGFDPTNNKALDGDYIKISHGRDYRDCMVMRGTMKGGGTQRQMVIVIVEEDK